MSYTFEWKHGENQTPMIVPVKLAKAVDKNYGWGGKLICNKCEGQLAQHYVCDNCKSHYSIGDIEKRKDNDTDAIYTKEQLKQFMQQEVEQVIRVEQEIPMTEFIPHIAFIKDIYEIYNNDFDVIPKVWKFLNKNNMGLIVTYGYREKMRAGIIYGGNDRVFLAELRDFNLIREAKQLQIPQTNQNEGLTEKLKAITESPDPQQHKEFIKKILNNEEIPIVETTEKKIVTVNADWLEG